MKKHIIGFLAGFLILIIGMITFKIETNNYAHSILLTPNFVIEKETLTYDISDDKVFRITNNNRDINTKLYIDNNLKNEIKIIVNYPNFNTVEYEYSVVNSSSKELININFETFNKVEVDNMTDIIKLGVISLKNKVKYNYAMLENAQVKIYVHEDYRDNIQFVGKYDEVYNPIR